MKRAKEHTKELGVHECIKTLNNEVDVESDQSHLLHLGQVLKGGKSNTHPGKEKAISKPNCRTQKTLQNYSYTDIYDFRTDRSLMLDDAMDVGNAEPDKAGGSGIQNTGQKSLANGGEVEKQRQQEDWKKGQQVTAMVYHCVVGLTGSLQLMKHPVDVPESHTPK